MSQYKGAFFSILIAIAVIVIVAVGALFAGHLSSEFGGGFRELVEDGDMANNTNVLNTVDLLETDAVGYADNIAFWFLITIVLGMLISGLFLEFEPAVIVILILVSALAVAISMLTANIYSDFSSSEALSTTASQMTLSSTVYGTVFPTIIFITFIATLIIMYSRKGNGGGNGF